MTRLLYLMTIAAALAAIALAGPAAARVEPGGAGGSGPSRGHSAHPAPQASITAPTSSVPAAASGDLPGRQRKALLLREFSGLSYDELAAVLHVSEPTVESLLFRARRELRLRLRPATGSVVVAPLGAIRAALSRAIGGLPDPPSAGGLAGLKRRGRRTQRPPRSTVYRHADFGASPPVPTT